MALCPTLFGCVCVCVGASERKGCVCFMVMVVGGVAELAEIDGSGGSGRGEVMVKFSEVHQGKTLF